MTDQKYTDTDEYQKEIAEQYKKRVAKFPISEVVKAVGLLGITIESQSTKEAVVGNVNATYLTPKLVVKMNQNRKEPQYLSNKVVSDRLSEKCPVVKVVAYDNFDKTDYEVLVMERAPGTLLLDNLPDLDSKVQENLFRQVLGAVKEMHGITFTDFGNVNGNRSFSSYTEYLKTTFGENIKIIREQKLCEEIDIASVEKYFLERVGIFDTESPVFIHADLHMGNILHDGEKLTAVIDFDHSLKAPAARCLLSLLGLIADPSQFVEGTSDFPKYKGKTFYNLLPILKEELPEIFADPLLLKKLNIMGMREGIDVIAGNWSADFNKFMIENIVKTELAENDAELRNSYYGKILSHSVKP